MREVLEDAEMSVPITLLHDDGSESVMRGIVGRFPLIVGDLDAPSKLSAWVSSPANDALVVQARVTRRDGAIDAYTVLETEPTEGALYGDIMSATTEYALRFAGAVAALADFDPADFSAADFG